MVKSPPCNAGDGGLIPGRETEISHATEQLSPRATTTEPEQHSWRVCMMQQRLHVLQQRRMQPNKQAFFKKNVGDPR